MDLELRGKKLITGTIAKPEILELYFIKGPPRSDSPNFLTIYSFIY